ncbi:glycerate kinase [Setomelanomma holmii]|uniref:Glycerate kinase n=1 Tax=Setomelanomma holmii TaxID=210430 RepID=A0A9P4LPB9_9PLEO|nr:glycerate kinase [Setomelanomma holmii]
MPRLRTLKTFNLSQAQVDEVLMSASSLLPTPTSEILGGHPLRILVAPSGFKESLGPEHVADAIEAGVRKVLDERSVILRKLPLHDGGEGFARALVAVQGGEIVDKAVMGPIGLQVESHLGFVGENRKTAVLDRAAAAGLRLVPKDARDPTVTTTYGVGELIAEALDAGSTKIIIGCGDLALPTTVLACSKRSAPASWMQTEKNCPEERVVAHWHVWLGSTGIIFIHAFVKTRIEAVCNIKNMLCGPRGVARVYGPQKGATPAQVDLLAASLDRLASVAQTVTRKDISRAPGSGASGSLGAGLIMLGARLRERFLAINEYFEFDQVFETQWDFGKMTTEVARRAKRSGAQVVALAGTIGEGADATYGAGIKALASLLRGPSTLEEAIVQTETLIKDGAEKGTAYDHGWVGSWKKTSLERTAHVKTRRGLGRTDL